MRSEHSIHAPIFERNRPSIDSVARSGYERVTRWFAGQGIGHRENWMSSARTRSWRCPECGNEIPLAVTQLDPIACDACLAKMTSRGGGSAGAELSKPIAGPLAIWQNLPETVKLLAVATALLIGLLMGFIAGQATSRQSPQTSTAASSHEKEVVVADEETEDRTPAPGPGYKWVKGRTRKDGTRGPSHWAKDPNYKGDR